MNKKKFYIISTCCVIALLIIFQLVMYFAVGEATLSQKGPMRTFWLLFPAVLISLTFVRDFIIRKKYENPNKK